MIKQHKQSWTKGDSMANLATELSTAIQQDMQLVAYSILHAINTNQYDSTADFETFMGSGFVERNITAISAMAEENPLRIGEVKLYAVPSVKNAPAINLYLARNLCEVKQLHIKRPEYEKGMSRIYDVSHRMNLEIEVNESNQYKTLYKLREEAEIIPMFLGTLREGFIDSEGQSIQLDKGMNK